MLDVFESSKFCLFLSKICCFYFATIEKQKNGVYLSRTKFRDTVLYIFYIFFGIYWIIDLIQKPSSDYHMRSFILEMGINLICKVQMIQTLISVSIAFLNRHRVVEILSQFDKIDAMVSFNLKNLAIKYILALYI